MFLLCLKQTSYTPTLCEQSKPHATTFPAAKTLPIGMTKVLASTTKRAGLKSVTPNLCAKNVQSKTCVPNTLWQQKNQQVFGEVYPPPTEKNCYHRLSLPRLKESPQPKYVGGFSLFGVTSASRPEPFEQHPSQRFQQRPCQLVR